MFTLPHFMISLSIDLFRGSRFWSDLKEFELIPDGFRVGLIEKEDKFLIIPLLSYQMKRVMTFGIEQEFRWHQLHLIWNSREGFKFHYRICPENKEVP